MSNLQTPFRYDFVGSFLRPANLKAAREGFENGKISADELKAVEDKEIERLNKEKDKLHKEIARCNGMLNNEKFTSKAPQTKIDEEKAKLEKYSDMLAQVEERLKTLSK